MQRNTVDLKNDDRGELFCPHQEAVSSGWSIGDPYPKLMKLAEGPSVQPGTLEALMDLPPQFSRMWPERQAYSIFGYDEVNQAFLDSETFSNRVYDTLTKSRLGDTLLNMDGSRHTRMRNVSKPWFKPSFTRSWWNEKWITRAVDELFEHITAKNHAELNMELCAPLPVSVISIGFGLASEDALPLRKAVHEVTLQRDAQKVVEANATIERILMDTIGARRATPKDDLISKFIEADFETEDGSTRKLTDDEVLRYCTLIIFAGGGTTWRQLGITIMALLDNPDQFELLLNDRGLLRATIQESTRWYPTDPVFLRWVEKDTVLGGVEMKAGSIAYLCIATANRDRSQWEDPNRFDIRRPIKRHFAFGSGPHACLGQHLSREEMEVALNALLDRLPNLRWNPDKPHPHITGAELVARGPDSLPVVFDPQ